MKWILLFSILPFVVLLVYPLVAWTRYKLSAKRYMQYNTTLQPVSILLSCYNEEKYIAEKINSLLDADEWIPGSELIVVSGGSTDRTNDILRLYTDERLKLIILEERIGKINSLNMAVGLTQHDILVFSDCRQKMKKGSIKKLVARFTHENIGTVAAVLEDSHSRKGSSFMRRCINRIAQWESATGSALCIYGALYAQRKTCFRPFPQDIIFEDLFALASTHVQQKKLVQEKEAVIYDIHFEDYYYDERIQRLCRGHLLFLFNHYGLIRQMRWGSWTRFMVYKYLKLLMPPALLLTMVSSFFLLGQNSWWWPLILVGSIVLLCVLPVARSGLFLLVRVNYFFFVSAMRFIFMKQRSVNWEKLKVTRV